MWRGRTHGAWFAAAVAIAVVGVVLLGSRSGGGGADGAGSGGAGSGSGASTDAGSWVIAIATFVAVLYCLSRAWRRKQGPPSER